MSRAPVEAAQLCVTKDVMGRLAELLGETPLRLLDVGSLVSVKQTG